MTNKISKCIHNGRLPSLNEYISKLNSNKYMANYFKQSVERDLVWTIKASDMKPIDKPCIVYVVYHEPDRRRDVDNIYSANKFILDALRKAGIIKNDSQKYVKDVIDTYITDGQSMVEIIVEKIEENQNEE